MSFKSAYRILNPMRISIPLLYYCSMLNMTEGTHDIKVPIEPEGWKYETGILYSEYYNLWRQTAQNNSTTAKQNIKS